MFLNQVNEERLSSSDDGAGKGECEWENNSWWLGADREGHECELEEEDFVDSETTVGTTGTRDEDGTEVGGDAGEERDKKVYSGDRDRRCASDRSGMCSLDQEFPGISREREPANGGRPVEGTGEAKSFNSGLHGWLCTDRRFTSSRMAPLRSAGLAEFVVKENCRNSGSFVTAMYRGTGGDVINLTKDIPVNEAGAIGVRCGVVMRVTWKIWTACYRTLQSVNVKTVRKRRGD